MDVNMERIANLIADIQAEQDRLEYSQKELKTAQQSVEEYEEDIESLRSAIRGYRDELDAYLDELIPDEVQASQDLDYESGLRRAFNY